MPSTPISYSVDIQDNIYIGLEDGTMLRFDSKGDQTLSYSLPNQSSITLIEAQNTLKTFLFYADNQQIITLDRFSTVPKIYDLAEYGVSFGLMACPSPDENFWVVENNPMRLKKIDPLRKINILEIQTNLGDSIKFMKSYKNLLLVLGNEEMHILDQFGSTLKRLSLDASYFQIVDNHLVLISRGQLLTVDPFSGEEVKKEIPPFQEVLNVLKTHQRTFFIKENSILVYE